MSRRSLLQAFGVGLVIALVAGLPLRLLLASTPGATPGFWAVDIQGTPWKGQVRELRWQGMPLGTVSLALAPSAWLDGSLAWQAEAPTWSGRLRVAPLRGVQDVSGHLALPDVGNVRLGLHSVHLLFDDDACVEASGMLELEHQAEPVPGQRLEARLQCEGPGAIARFAPAGPASAGSGNAAIELRIDGQGHMTLSGAAWTALGQGAGPAAR